MVFCWCGAGDRVPLERVIERRGWQHLSAVRQGRIFCIADEWLNSPAPSILLGLRALAAALHPSRFDAKERPRSFHTVASARNYHLVNQVTEADKDDPQKTDAATRVE